MKREPKIKQNVIHIKTKTGKVKARIMAALGGGGRERVMIGGGEWQGFAFR